MRGILWTLFIIVAAFRGRDKGGSQEHGISVKKRSGPGKRKISRGGVKKPDEAALIPGEPKSREQTRFEKTDLEANGQSDAPRSMSAADLGREGSAKLGKLKFTKLKILQIFSGLVLGSIKTKFCKKICV